MLRSPCAAVQGHVYLRYRPSGCWTIAGLGISVDLFMIIVCSLILLALSNPCAASQVSPLDPADLRVSTSAELAAGLENNSVSTILLFPTVGGVRSLGHVRWLDHVVLPKPWLLEYAYR